MTTLSNENVTVLNLCLKHEQVPTLACICDNSLKWESKTAYIPSKQIFIEQATGR